MIGPEERRRARADRGAQARKVGRWQIDRADAQPAREHEMTIDRPERPDEPRDRRGIAVGEAIEPGSGRRSHAVNS